MTKGSLQNKALDLLTITMNSSKFSIPENDWKNYIQSIFFPYFKTISQLKELNK